MQPRGERFTTPALGGIQLHALHWGPADAPMLLLLHGGGANAHWWDHVSPRLAARWHVVALDFRGHGDSDWPEALVVGGFNDDLEETIRHLQARDVVLLGHSMGAGVALGHAASETNGHRVRGLIAVDVSRGASRRARRGARLALALRRTYTTREEAIARYRFLPTAAHATEALRLAIAAHSIREEPDGRYGFKFDPRWFTIGSRERPPLSRIRCPTLFLRGSESPMLTADGIDAFLAEVPQARAQTITGAGHHLHLDRPEAFLDAVLPFLASLET